MPVIVDPEPGRQAKAHCQNGAERKRNHAAGDDATPTTVTADKLDHFATCTVAAADDDALKNCCWQQETANKEREVHCVIATGSGCV